MLCSLFQAKRNIMTSTSAADPRTQFKTSKVSRFGKLPASAPSRWVKPITWKQAFFEAQINFSARGGFEKRRRINASIIMDYP
jgi:hypothetical protein